MKGAGGSGKGRSEGFWEGKERGTLGKDTHTTRCLGLSEVDAYCLSLPFNPNRQYQQNVGGSYVFPRFPSVKF